MLLKNKQVQLWARRLHVYVSMALLLVVLFFSITGITLNRPDWFVSSSPDIKNTTLSVPNSVLFSQDEKQHTLWNKPNTAALLDYLNQHTDLSGTPSNVDVFTDVEDGELVEGELSLNYKGPGYNASVYIDLTTGMADIESSNYGVVALLNDLHKGRNSGEVWKAFIDITALLMIFFVLTGVCLILPKKRTLMTSMKWMAFGSSITLALYFIAVP